MPPTGDGPPTDDLPPDESRGKSAQVLRAFQSNYSQVQYHYVQFLADHLTDCRKTLGGDFDDLMMMAVLGQRFLGARQAIAAGETGAEDRIWMSALRLSDVTGVPRESVRRKLIRLQARGWVTQNPVKGWCLAGSMDRAAARDDLDPLDARGLERLARLVAALLPLAASRAPGGPDDDGPA